MLSTMKRLVLVITFLLVVLLACPPVFAEQGTMVKVVTSISPLADIVSNVGYPYVTVHHFVPMDVDPHSYEPTFSALAPVSQAQIIFLNGDGLDRLAEEALRGIKLSSSQVVELASFIPKGDKVAGDPHYWLNPKFAEIYVATIASALSKIDPAHSKQYFANARSYCGKIEALDLRYLNLCRQLPVSCRHLVLYHNSWTYLTQRYGFDVVGIVENGGEQEPSARHLATIITKARAVHARAIVAEFGHGTKILKMLQEEAAIPKVVQTVEDSLAKPPTDTYLGMMEFNLKGFGQICQP
jgi:ABC-type Zn uptake system ZnuABC Zn-binding protein ZnuA